MPALLRLMRPIRYEYERSIKQYQPKSFRMVANLASGQFACVQFRKEGERANKVECFG
jgi:hypothetical protein